MTSGTVQAPPSPTIADIGNAIRVLDGEPAKRVRDLMNAIFEQSGSLQDQVDWSDPDRWIDARLAGELQTLARKVWEGSGKTVNPRYLYRHHTYINRLKLLESVDGIYRLGERGRLFLAGDDEIRRELAALRSSKRPPTRPPESPWEG
jgi:restriction system protein